MDANFKLIFERFLFKFVHWWFLVLWNAKETCFLGSLFVNIALASQGVVTGSVLESAGHKVGHRYLHELVHGVSHEVVGGVGYGAGHGASHTVS